MFLVKIFILLLIIISTPIYFLYFHETPEKIMIENKAEKIATYFQSIKRQHKEFLDRGFAFVSFEDMEERRFLIDVDELYLGKMNYDAKNKVGYITRRISHDEFDHSFLDKKACVKINENYYPTIKCIRGSIGNIDFKRLKSMSRQQAVLEAGLTKEGTLTSIMIDIDYIPKKKTKATNEKSPS